MEWTIPNKTENRMFCVFQHIEIKLILVVTYPSMSVCHESQIKLAMELKPFLERSHTAQNWQVSLGVGMIYPL